MKTRITLLAMLIISSVSLDAQTIMNIHQSNGTVLQIPLNTIDSITYTINNPGNLATLTTLPVGNITNNAAVSGGNITNNGGTPVTQRGVVWGTSPNPTTANNSTDDGSGTGSYTSTLTGLTANTTYYVRAYATNSAGTAYGNQLSFTTAGGGGGIVSNPGAGVTFNGYTYSSVVLGNGQEWMAENLRTTIYANGDPIPNVTINSEWQNPTGVAWDAWSHYDNNNSYENPYGKLYNWYAVSDSRNVCPTGWHVPSDAEWNSLIGYLDPAFNPSAIGIQSSIASIKMRSTGSQFWQIGNTNATNEIGFSALPGGNRLNLGTFFDIGSVGYWWSSQGVGGNDAYFRSISINVMRGSCSSKHGFSVRCIKD